MKLTCGRCGRRHHTLLHVDKHNDEIHLQKREEPCEESNAETQEVAASRCTSSLNAMNEICSVHKGPANEHSLST